MQLCPVCQSQKPRPTFPDDAPPTPLPWSVRFSAAQPCCLKLLSWNFHHLRRHLDFGKTLQGFAHVRLRLANLSLLPYPIATAYRCVCILCCLDRKSKGEKIFTPPPISVCLDLFSSHSHLRFFHLDLVYPAPAPAPAPAPRIPGRSTTAHAEKQQLTSHYGMHSAFSSCQLCTVSLPLQRLVPHSGLASPDSTFTSSTQPPHLRNPASRSPPPSTPTGTPQHDLHTNKQKTYRSRHQQCHIPPSGSPQS
ncbi:hypothetical protein B0T14DRAFT_322728 [Immersiella caudata]|uniref:Uncharacterized protein n=1 Tax=Immersiella caudata TaxID=314043 RepID=A0AA39WA52_9PEZI|nr:hypothetical protein B0T14DRAFT_322728 [Immersiella caudata]